MNRTCREIEISEMAGSCLSGRLRLMNRLVNSIYDTALREYSIKASQVSILAMVAKLGETNCKTLCGHMQMDSSTFSRSLARLRKNGWLKSESSGDGKILKITVTPDGSQVLHDVYPVWKQAQDEAFSYLGAELAEMLQKSSIQAVGAGEKLLLGDKEEPSKKESGI